MFPRLYLPLMAESYLRSLRPWRLYLPTRSWFQYNSRMAELDGYLKNCLRERWTHRQQDLRKGQRQDIVDLLMSAIEVSSKTEPLNCCSFVDDRTYCEGRRSSAAQVVA